MKLAEALLLRAEYQNKLDSLQKRLLTNLRIQEGDEPQENPKALLAESFATQEALCGLIKRINARNNAATLPGGQTLAEALADRDMLLKKRASLTALTGAAGERMFRLTRSEVKQCLTLSIGELQSQIDALSRQYRELDTQIQALNWTTDL